MPRQTVNYSIISGCISVVSINNVPIADKVSGLLELKIVTFDPSLMTLRNLEHFPDLFIEFCAILRSWNMVTCQG